MNEEATITLVGVACITTVVIASLILYKPAIKYWKRFAPPLSNLMRNKDATVDEWDQVSIFYRVPSTTIGFLGLTHIVLWITIGIAADGIEELTLSNFFALWYITISGLDSIIGIIGVIGIVCFTVYGVHEDFPRSRLKILAAIGLFGIMVGLGYRFD